MKLFGPLLLMLTLLSGCLGNVKVPNPDGVCSGLRHPIDRLANEVLEHSTETHGDVVIAATTVIRGYDGGCRG